VISVVLPCNTICITNLMMMAMGAEHAYPQGNCLTNVLQ
jgi:hypothetical protein